MPRMLLLCNYLAQLDDESSPSRAHADRLIKYEELTQC